MTAVKQALTDDANYLRGVRKQYEQYPYPPRDPAAEKTTFRYSRTCSTDCLNYYHYEGKRDFTKGFRALIAGGGTGDSTIFLGEQFRGLDAEIVHIDLSARSLQVAQERAKVRELDNITWVHGSLLDAPKIFTGKFDFIESSGVLHHLENPEAGLAALTSLLNDDGVICLMLYARHGGRIPVYQMQELMRILNKNEQNMQQKIDNCKIVLNQLPTGSAIKALQQTSADIRDFGDVGIYDMFLHSHDRAYSVPEVYQFLASAGLKPSHFFYNTEPEGNDLYRLEHYLGKELSDTINQLSLQEKQAAAELMHGKILFHGFYAAKQLPSLPSPDDLDNVPFFFMTMKNKSYESFYEILSKLKVGETCVIEHHDREVTCSNTPHLARIFQFMDGHKSLREIFSQVILSYGDSKIKPEINTLLSEFKNFFAAFNKHDLMFLRHKSVPLTVRIDDIRARNNAMQDPLNTST